MQFAFLSLFFFFFFLFTSPPPSLFVLHADDFVVTTRQAEVTFSHSPALVPAAVRYLVGTVTSRFLCSKCICWLWFYFQVKRITGLLDLKDIWVSRWWDRTIKLYMRFVTDLLWCEEDWFFPVLEFPFWPQLDSQCRAEPRSCRRQTASSLVFRFQLWPEAPFLILRLRLWWVWWDWWLLLSLGELVQLKGCYLIVQLPG